MRGSSCCCDNGSRRPNNPANPNITHVGGRNFFNCPRMSAFAAPTRPLARKLAVAAVISPTPPTSLRTTTRGLCATMSLSSKLKPAARVSGQKQDVWSIINEAAAASPKQPIVNMGQGFFGYNPPRFILDAAKEALERVDCNQYSPTKGRPRLKKAIADSYSPHWGRAIDPETEVTITTGANEGMLSAFMAFLEDGDEVIIFEPFFDQYVGSKRVEMNGDMPGGKIVYVPLHPPATGATTTSSAADWTVDFDELERAITPKTKMIVINTPHNPVGKVFSKDELQKIADLCVKNEIIILSDEVYDKLYYVPFTRIATLSPEVERLTLTVGSAGKNFYATGWRVGWLIGPEHLIKYVAAAHTRICYSSVSPLQEACAVGFEQADAHGFWDATITEMKGKMDRFNAVWEELGLPYSEPEGGYFVLVNMAQVRLPADYPFPAHVASRPRDFKLAWFLIQEVGVAAIPPTEFYTDENTHLAEDYIRFAVCKEDSVLEEAKNRLRGLKKYMAK
ncbi:kynurenine-oxoglutarate transaminase 1 [Cordyceps militaris CM01]|uniref:Kynurenine-oxoglutarate transaminase 1 n=1 Tax=Cordyceps militaris (strain CM01) TaxID=983644 RepID=G3JST8_CORMM|nr:kynurenine-oxoglutarate transaminase 1 [Cordyceps militaris CM01]EGX88934.1 kynurenine-oxoglutarate transaminase 1 [Cordyceps militaris CM01]